MAACDEDTKIQDGKEDEKETEDNERLGLPVDRGWAWAVLAAAWMNMFIVVGIYKVFGIFFVEYQKKYQSSSSLTSVITSALNASYSPTALLTMTVVIHFFSARTCVMIGSLLCCIGFAASAFANDMAVLVFTNGVLVGIGNALVLPPTVSILGLYFKKRHGLANSLSITGGSIAGLLLPSVLHALLDTYSIFGALIIVAGIHLNCLVGAVMLRPPSFYQRSSTRKENGSVEHVNSVKENDKKEQNQTLLPFIEDMRQRSESDTTTKGSDASTSMLTNGLNAPKYGEQLPDVVSRPSPLIARALRNRRPRTRTLSNSLANYSIHISESSLTRYASTELATCSVLDLRSDHSERGESCSNEGNVEKGGTSGAIFNCKLLTNCVFLVYLASAGLLACGNSLIQLYLPPHCKDVGLSEEQSGLLISIIGGVDLCSLVLWGFISDRGWIKPNNIVALASLVNGICCQFISLYTTFPHLVIFSVIYGVFGRVYFSLYPVVLVHFLGLSNLKSALGFSMLLQACAGAATMPVVGKMRDVTGSYNASYHLIGAYLIIGACGFISLPLVKKHCCKKNDEDYVP